MAARTWFTPEICEGLAREDCAILNRAARNVTPLHKAPTHAELMALRMAYRPGMSAAELIDKALPEQA